MRFRTLTTGRGRCGDDAKKDFDAERGLNASRLGLCTTITPRSSDVASLGYRGLPLVRKTERKGKSANRPYHLIRGDS